MVERSAALVLSAPPKSEGCAAMISLQRLTQGLRPSMPSNSFEPFVMRERPEHFSPEISRLFPGNWKRFASSVATLFAY
jgi:hypothetical protein